MAIRPADAAPEGATLLDQAPVADPAPDPTPGPGTDVVVSAPADLAVVEPTGPLAAFAGDEWAGVDSGLENWDHVGFVLPKIVSDMRPGGGWTDEVTGETADALDGIFLAAMPARAYWKEAFGKGDAAPDCRSADMERPDPNSPSVQSTTCAACPMSQWDGQEPPACKERINALVFLPDSGEIRRTTIGGTSVKHFRRYVSALQARAQRKPIYAQVTHCTTEQVEGDGMRWLEAHFIEGDPVDPAMARNTLMPLQREVSAAWKSLIAQDLASPDADGTAVARGAAIDVDGSVKFDDGEEPF